MATKNKAATAAKAPKAKRSTTPLPKGTTRADQVWRMIERPEGVSITEIVEETGLQPHTARALLSVQRRKRGATLELKEGRYRVTE